MTTTLTIRKPDDFHCHLRQKNQGKIFPTAVGFAAKCFGRVVAMGNTIPAIATADDADVYRQEILATTPAGVKFEPIMTIMLTKQTTPETVSGAVKQGIRVLKYIPEGASTNSEESVPLEKLSDYYPVLETARDSGMIFSGHWESLRDKDGRELNDMDRETAAIPFLDKIAKLFPNLQIVVEHASTIEMLDYVSRSPMNVGCTLTVHHALLNYQDVCDDRGRIQNPHHYCKPILKSERDRIAVLRAMLSGNPHFFFGSDSAPHLKGAKEKIPPATGIFSAPVATPLLAYIFETNGSLGIIENFVSVFGADFYGLPQNTEAIELVKKEWAVPDEYNRIVPFMAGKTMHWQVAE
ncbi:MAG: dihydroorotase [bacterium]